MKAFLLAAGIGSRLRPITDTMPKCMVTIDDQPLLDIWFDAFNRAGVDEVLVNLHHLPDVVRRHVAARTRPPTVQSRLRARAPRQRRDAARQPAVGGRRGFFLACNADNLTDFELQDLIDVHRTGDAVATLTAFHSENPSAGGVLEVDEAGRMTGFTEKPTQPTSDLVNAGMYAFSPAVLDEIRQDPPVDIGYDLLPALVGRARGGASGRLFPRHRYARGLPPSQEGMARPGRTMIITQTPLRIGLLGGGTDLPDYYRENGGRVLNCAIDKYIYVIVKQRFDNDIYVNYSKKEIVSRVEDLEHELVREAMLMTGVTSGVEITTLADIPSAGSGLGSSSTVTVGLLNALYAYQGRQVSASELASSGVRDRDRTMREAHRQARSVHRRPRRDPGPPLRSRRRGDRRRSGAGRRRSAVPCSARSCCSTPGSPGARIPSWPSRMPSVASTRPHLDQLRDLAGLAVEATSRR